MIIIIMMIVVMMPNMIHVGALMIMVMMIMVKMIMVMMIMVMMIMVKVMSTMPLAGALAANAGAMMDEPSCPLVQVSLSTSFYHHCIVTVFLSSETSLSS